MPFSSVASTTEGLMKLAGADPAEQSRATELLSQPLSSLSTLEFLQRMRHQDNCPDSPTTVIVSEHNDAFLATLYTQLSGLWDTLIPQRQKMHVQNYKMHKGVDPAN